VLVISYASVLSMVFQVVFGGARGVASTMEGKQEKVAAVKDLLDKSEMIFATQANSLSVIQVQNLRASLPDGTTVSVVKNKLMARAVEGTTYEVAAGEGLLKGANMWFFIEEDIGGTVKALAKFNKDNGKLETHAPNFGVIDGDSLDTDGVVAVSKLPSKIELIARIAGGIKAVPTKVGRVIKAPSSKLARAIKLATEEVNKEE
jgi:large subunit ribosomal protein L10